ncbi:SUMF1/EgtB/PvdO family nonheme iron enzyme [Chitinophaga sp.]|uniref:SUMF1/EgtB/PvdO family nonheme iron enzyme n=1 Tax=Chitinophaga sp. TaxID=1869181 RepID=UPI0031D58B09
MQVDVVGWVLLADGEGGEGMKKHDVAISVAEEDKEVAYAIAAQLKKLKVRYYYYDEHKDNWGKYLINLTMDAYGRHTKYVLMITSRAFVQKYWSGIERQVALSRLPQGDILQLRLDDTQVDGLSAHMIYEDWKDNPEEIARLLKEKIGRKKWLVWARLMKICTSLLVLLMAVMSWYWAYMWYYHRHFAQTYVLVAGARPFFISNVEVTVAAYREYCMLTHKVFPEQPIHSVDSMPVRNVTWEEAKAYCAYVKGRLPSELEWETAAQGGESTVYSGGTSAVNVAVYHKVKPAFVGRKKANALGIYDMSGNVAEWCEDWADSAKTMKVVKGGGYDSEVEELAVKSRREERPEARLRDVGFRVVKDQ